MAGVELISQKNRDRYLRFITPVGNLLARLKLHPNVVTLAGLVLSAVAGWIYSTGAFFWAAWVLVLAGSCDVLDGQLARSTGRNTSFGAFFDSTMDRFGEILVFMGLAWYFSGGSSDWSGAVPEMAQTRSPVSVVLILLAASGSMMVSYTRARAEALGIECKVGWMQRPERLTLLVIGSLLAGLPVVGLTIMKLTLLALALTANFTALQRVMHVRNQLVREKV
jgi:CDP-diacylglycerol---glycerol-3-phosphate 3-phosphatidyltransferase